MARESTGLPPVLAEQGPRMHAHLERIIAILEAHDDARLHQDDMRTAIRELRQFVAALPNNKGR